MIIATYTDTKMISFQITLPGLKQIMIKIMNDNDNMMMRM